MPTNLPRLIPASDSTDRVEVQATTLGLDLVSRYHCSTWDEVFGNGGAPFDVVVIGAGMFGAYCAEKIYRNGEKALLRVLVLDAGTHLVSEHAQNLSPMDIVAPGAALVRTNNEQVAGLEWLHIVARDQGAFSFHYPGNLRLIVAM